MVAEMFFYTFVVFTVVCFSAICFIAITLWTAAERRLMMEEERLHELRARRMNEEVSSVRVKETTTEGMVRERVSRFSTVRDHPERPQDTRHQDNHAQDRLDSAPPSRPLNFTRHKENGHPKRSWNSSSSVDSESNTSVVTAVIESPPNHKQMLWECDKVQTSSPKIQPNQVAQKVDRGQDVNSMSTVVPRSDQEQPKIQQEKRCEDGGHQEGGDSPLLVEPQARVEQPLTDNRMDAPPAQDKKDPKKVQLETLNMEVKEKEEPSCVVDCLYYTMQCCECSIM